ncbi:MAG: flagellar basal body rod protein FlgC [Bacteroidetes bacterium]|nr:flagellar basal body rod protein FlgC [Bacteroidota bacterium]
MKIDRLFAGLNISAMGLSAQRKRMDAIATNMANIETTRTENGEPYRRKVVAFAATTGKTFGGILQSIGGRLATTNTRHFETGLVPVGTSSSTPTGVESRESTDDAPFRLTYDPSHPDADANGYVRMPNVNVVTEMVDMISATRAYEANVTVVNGQKQMSRDALEI